MKRMKRFCALLLALCMMFALAPAASAANGTIVMNLNSNTMTVNGTSVAIDSDASIKPQVKKINGNGYTMLPLRAVVEAMGGTVAYNASTKVITLTYNGNTLTHTIGTTKATVNGTAKTMDVASYAENNRTYVHLRVIEMLSSGVKVNWNASSPNTVTITYTPGTSSATKNVSLTIVNAATGYLQLSSLKLAPAGTKTYSGNLLSTTLLPGGQRTLTMAIAPGKYDLQGVEATTGATYTWYNLDFSTIQSKATLTLTSLSQYVLSVDSSLTGDKTSSVTIINATGGTITGISAYPTSAGASSATRVSSAVVSNGSSTSFTMAFSSAAPYYALQVQFSSGYTITYPSIRIDSGYMTLTLKGDGTYTYGGTNANSSTGVYFVNRTGSKISTLQMKIGSSGSWSANLLSGSLKSGDYIDIPSVSTSDVRNQTVYFRTSTSGSGKSVKVTSTTKNSVVFSLGSSLSVKYNVDPGEKTYEEGLWLYNDSDVDFDKVYVINAEDFDEDDYKGSWSDPEDYFKDHTAESSRDDDYEWDEYAEYVKNLDDRDEDFIDEWDADELAGADLYFKAESGNDTYYGEISVGKSSKFDYNVYVTIDIKSSKLDLDIDYDYAEDDDDDSETDTGLLFYNKTGEKIKAIYVSTKEALTSSTISSSNRVISNLGKKDWEQADDYDSYSKDVEDETIYYYVVYDSSTSDYKGSMEFTRSNKDNVCIILNGSSSKDDYEYDWSTDSGSSDGDGVYFYNNSGYKVTNIAVNVGSSSSSGADDVYTSSIKNGKTVEIDLDLDDISEETVYFWIDYIDDDGDDETSGRLSVSVDEYEDDYDDNVLFKFTGSRVKVSYDVDIDDYI